MHHTREDSGIHPALPAHQSAATTCKGIPLHQPNRHLPSGETRFTLLLLCLRHRRRAGNFAAPNSLSPRAVIPHLGFFMPVVRQAFLAISAPPILGKSTRERLLSRFDLSLLSFSPALSPKQRATHSFLGLRDTDPALELALCDTRSTFVSVRT